MNTPRPLTLTSSAAWATRIAQGQPIDAQGWNRLETTLLTAAREYHGRIGKTCEIKNLEATLITAIRTVGVGPSFGLDSETTMRLHNATVPFTVVMTSDSKVRIELMPHAANLPSLGSEASYLWVGGLAMPALDVDLVHIPFVNSVTIAWLLQLAHQASPAPVRLLNAGRQVVAQLRQLKIDQLLLIG